MKRNTLIVLIGTVLVLITALLLFVFQVRKSEMAVVTTFGRPTRPITEPGAYFKWPKPIQNVYKYDQRIQNFNDIYSESLTADSTMLLTSVYVGWQISDASVFLSTFPGDSSVSLPNAQGKLEGILRTAKSAVIGKHLLADFVNVEAQGLKFAEIEKEIESSVQSQLSTNNYGIRLEFLGFKKIGLPESVTQTVFDRMKSERQVLISRAENEGRKDAQIIESTADSEAVRTIANAQATATGIRAQGEAEAAKTLSTFQQNPDLAVFLLRIKAWQQSLNQRSTLIFDERYPPFDLFRNLPANATGRQP
jgi:membrane protease subunit HflC